MVRTRSAFWSKKRFTLLLMCAVPALLLETAIFGQETIRKSSAASAGGPYPRLPGAVVKAPEGLETNAPFDIKKSFMTLPRDRNAAPLYLDAFFEFGNEVAICFPPGPETERRRQAASDRVERYRVLEESLAKDPKAVPDSAIEAVVKLYDTGFRKLADAQRRQQCVFESGLSFATLLPHVQAARQVTRVAALKVRIAPARQNFDKPFQDLETVLRLARDLRPRGGLINQLVVVAMSQVVYIDMIPRILSAPGLSVEHCDRLLTLLASHESKSIDGYSEGLRADYLAIRVTLRDLVRHQGVLAEQLGLKRGESVAKALASSMYSSQGDGAQPVPDDADAQLARTSPAKLASKVRELSRYFGALLELRDKPHAKRIAQANALKMAGGDDVLSRLVTQMTASPEPFTRAIAREAASLHATECLIAVRRWQLGHPGSPRDLATAIVGSPLKAVPSDPYDGKPMRLTLLDGQPVVYSVGRDGKDDGGQIDSDRDQRPTGDLIYRLSSTAPAR